MMPTWSTCHDSNHKPYIVNLDQILYIKPLTNGKSMIIFNGERTLTVEEDLEQICAVD
jgi:hypothetical protein